MSWLRTASLIAMGGIVAVSLILFGGRGDLRADEPTDSGGEAEGPPVDEEGVEATPVEPRNFFQLYPADEGALSYDDLSDQDQAHADRAAEWAEADCGYEVHQAWARGTAWAREHARLVSAERTADLEGADTTGVE